jgi:L-seryl-tRNA(Ser) seleniumtransferase
MAGLIVGKRDIIECIKKNQLNRALRIDKFTLAALESVLRLYYDHETVVSRIPTLAMLAASPRVMEQRARRLARKVRKPLAERCAVAVRTVGSRVGGGALPEEEIESRCVELAPLDRTVNELERSLRLNQVPVIGRIEDDRYLLDMRTVQDDEVPLIATVLARVFEVDL